MRSFPTFLFLKVGDINIDFLVDSVALMDKKVRKKLPNSHRAFAVKAAENIWQSNILILSPA